MVRFNYNYSDYLCNLTHWLKGMFRVDNGLENPEKMPEAEVSLRLALYLIRNKLVSSDVLVALDGAQIKTGNTIHFHINEFLQDNNCVRAGSSQGWQGLYKVDNYEYALKIHSNPGKGDVVTKLFTGNGLRVECKKGPLVNSKSSQEYPLLREALGQLLTVNEYDENDRLAVAVPDSLKFRDLTSSWRNAPLIHKLQLGFLLISRNGEVSGLHYLLH